LRRDDAIARARAELTRRGIALGDDWRALAAISSGPDTDVWFAWREGSRETYRQLLGAYLDVPEWEVRFIRPGAEVSERAEEHRVSVRDGGARYWRRLPEARPGKKLAQPEARALALEAVRRELKLDVSAWKEARAVSEERPARRDWVFVFTDPAVSLPMGGEARVRVTLGGDETLSVSRGLFVPEQWERQYRRDWSMQRLLGQVAGVPRWLLFLALGVTMILAIRDRVFGGRIFAGATLVFVLFGAMLGANQWPTEIAEFTTVEPWGEQVTGLLVSLGGKTLAMAVFAAAILGFALPWLRLPSTKAERRKLVWGSLALGAIGAFWPRLGSWLFPFEGPPWVRIEGADQALPSLASLELVFACLTSSALWCVVLSALSRATRRVRSQGARLALALAVGMLAGAEIPGGFGITAWSWLGDGVFAVAAYWLAGRLGLFVVPAALGFQTLCVLLQSALAGLAPGATGRLGTWVLVLAASGALALSFGARRGSKKA
jgi:hypothetical protein